MIINKIKTTLGTITNSILNNVVSPIDRLEYHLEQKEDNLKEIMDNVTKLHTEIRKLESTTDSYDRDIYEATRSAQQALKDDNEELAKMILERKITLTESRDKNVAFISELKSKEQVLRNRAEIYKQGINDIKAQIQILKTDDNIANVKLSVAEHTSNLNGDSFEITKQTEKAHDQINNKNARADSIIELEENGAYDVLLNKDDIGDEIKKQSKKASVNEELEKMKAEM